MEEEISFVQPEISVFLFQAVRELLFNVTKHAHVNSACVRVAGFNGQLQVAVEDEGSGFDHSLLRSEGGSSGGFGLFKMNERVSMLGGHLQVESSPGRGTRITLTLPDAGMAVADTGRPASVRLNTESGRIGKLSDPQSKKVRIVLVDDHSVMRHGLAVMLREQPDFEIMGEASDGESGVSLVRRLRPDVVLMDVSMPGMNGIEATQIIHSEHPEIMVIGLSMFREGEQAAAMKNAGAVNYVAKSDPPENIVYAIQACRR